MRTDENYESSENDNLRRDECVTGVIPEPRTRKCKENGRNVCKGKWKKIKCSKSDPDEDDAKDIGWDM